MSEPGAKLDSAGQAVAERVHHLRVTKGLSVRKLSALLSEAGRPILPSGILKLEQGVRRIDVDDLVALAAVMHVTPAVLLTGQEESDVTSLLDDEATAARRLGTTMGHLRELRRRGLVGYVKVGHLIKYSERDIAEFIERSRVPTVSQLPETVSSSVTWSA